MSTFDERRRARADWLIRRVSLGDEPLTDERIVEDVDARIAMVWTLTRYQWELSGRPFPEYERSETPGRVVRPRP